MLSFTHEQNITCICSPALKPQQTIICRQLFAGHLVGSRSMKRKKIFHQIIIFIPVNFCFSIVFGYGTL